MSLALSTCVLLISLMEIVNGAQFLKITFLLVLYVSASAVAVLLKVIVPLTRIYIYHYNHIS